MWGFSTRRFLKIILWRADGTQGIYIVVYCSAVKAIYEYGDVHVITIKFEPRHVITNALVSDLVRHKPGCIATENCKRREISDLEGRDIVLSM